MTFWEKISLTFSAWPLWLWVLGVMVAVVLYHRWHIRKNRFAGSPSLPREIPPKNHSPAVLRYVFVQEVDGDSLIAAILSAVVKNIYRVRWQKSSFRVEHNPLAPATRLTRDERAALTFNGRDYIPSMKVGRNRNRLTRKAEHRLRNYIRQHYRQWLFPYRWHLLGSLAVCLVLLGAGAAWIGPVPHLFMVPYFMLGWSMMALCSVGVWYAWREQNWAAFAIAAVFGTVCLIALWQLESSFPAYMFPFLVPVVALHGYFFLKLPRLRPAGSRLQVQIEEFRSFLTQKVENRQKLSPTEYYLIPYLVALEIPFGEETYFSELLTHDPGVPRLPGSPV